MITFWLYQMGLCASNVQSGRGMVPSAGLSCHTVYENFPWAVFAIRYAWEGESTADALSAFYLCKDSQRVFGSCQNFLNVFVVQNFLWAPVNKSLSVAVLESSDKDWKFRTWALLVDNCNHFSIWLNGTVLPKEMMTFFLHLCLICSELYTCILASVFLAEQASNLILNLNSTVKQSESITVVLFLFITGVPLPPLKLGHSDCALKADEGPCKAIHVRFYFNIQSRECEIFEYGGCHGNANNFLTLEECQNKCVVTGQYPFSSSSSIGSSSCYPQTLCSL